MAGDVEFLAQGKWIDSKRALAIVEAYGERDLWDKEELRAIWKRMMDPQAYFNDRLECAETITRLTLDNVEIFVEEPS